MSHWHSWEEDSMPQNEAVKIQVDLPTMDPEKAHCNKWGGGTAPTLLTETYPPISHAKIERHMGRGKKELK